jgi:hypothetical protein
VPSLGTTLQRRQEAQPAAVIATAWKAQQRLRRTWRRLDTERGKRKTIVAVAVARQLVGFVWAIATTAASLAATPLLDVMDVLGQQGLLAPLLVPLTGLVRRATRSFGSA